MWCGFHVKRNRRTSNQNALPILGGAFHSPMNDQPVAFVAYKFTPEKNMLMWESGETFPCPNVTTYDRAIIYWKTSLI